MSKIAKISLFAQTLLQKQQEPRKKAWFFFCIDWEQRKLSDLAEKTYGGGTPATSSEAFWNGTIPWIQSSDIADGKLFGVVPRKYITNEALNKSATQLVPENSLAIITRVGVGKLAFMPFSYTTSQDFLSLSKLNTEPFFTVYACYKKLQAELNAVQGTSIKGITKDELLAKAIMVPKYREQEQIGCFFRSLDNLITLHQRKGAATPDKKNPVAKSEKKQKKTNDWEQRKLSELGKIETGNTPSTSISDYYSDNGLLWVTPTDITSNILFNTEKKLSNKGVAVARVIPENSILCTCIASIGKNAFLPVKCAFNQQINALSPYKKNYPYFLFADSYHWSITMKNNAGGLTFQIVNKSEFSNIKTCVPKYEEQEKIGNLFYKLDNLITLHQRE